MRLSGDFQSWILIITPRMLTGIFAGIKAYADSHEVDDAQPANERDMDLRNNRLGRAMAIDPRFKSLSPDEAAELALRKGWLHGLQR